MSTYIKDMRTLGLAAFIGLAACSQSKLSGGDGTYAGAGTGVRASTQTASATGTDTSTDTSGPEILPPDSNDTDQDSTVVDPMTCTESTKASDLKLVPDVQSCINSGHLWDQINNKCATIGPAQSFDCKTFTDIAAAFDHYVSGGNGYINTLMSNVAQNLGLKIDSGLTPSGTVMKYLQTRHAIILGCGEKTDDTVAALFYIPPYDVGGKFKCNHMPVADEIYSWCFAKSGVPSATVQGITTDPTIVSKTTFECLNH